MKKFGAVLVILSLVMTMLLSCKTEDTAKKDEETMNLLLLLLLINASRSTSTTSTSSSSCSYYGTSGGCSASAPYSCSRSAYCSSSSSCSNLSCSAVGELNAQVSTPSVETCDSSKFLCGKKIATK